MKSNKYLVLINMLSAHADSVKSKLHMFTDGYDVEYCDISIIDNAEFFKQKVSNDNIIICGGDGSLNYFVNHIPIESLSNNIYYYPCGAGNDFSRDIGRNELIQVNEYTYNLPKVKVNDETYMFLNGVGYGIDGYCCEKGDALKAKNKKVNYALIAIKGLLFHYKPTTAVVSVDGERYTFNKVWLAPTMKGKYYGGGMMISPNQNRNNSEGLLSVVIMHGSSKLKTLVVFPSIFKGEHIKHNEMISIFTGKNIVVEFDRETSLQVDGETIKNVKKYEVYI